VVAKRAPLNFQSYALRNADYPPNTTIAGIEWDFHLLEIHVAVNNPTDSDYENLDVGMQPDVWSHKAGLLTTDNECHVSAMPITEFIKGIIFEKSTDTITTVRPGEDTFDAHTGTGPNASRR
jgi:hypothetical protein